MVQLAVAVLVNSIFLNVQANMAKGTRQINMDIFFTNRKLTSIHPESVPRSRLKASAYSTPKKKAIFYISSIYLVTFFICFYSNKYHF